MVVGSGPLKQRTHIATVAGIIDATVGEQQKQEKQEQEQDESKANKGKNSRSSTKNNNRRECKAARPPPLFPPPKLKHLHCKKLLVPPPHPISMLVEGGKGARGSAHVSAKRGGRRKDASSALLSTLRFRGWVCALAGGRGKGGLWHQKF